MVSQEPVANISFSAAQVVAACHAWNALEAAVGPLSTSQTPANAQRMDGLMHTVLDHLRESAKPAAGAHRLLDFLTEWVSDYEQAHTHIAHSSPVDLLRFLIETNNLKQRDLAPDLGGQPSVSAILHGKRQINARQAMALAKRFSLSAAAFLADDTAPRPRARQETSQTYVDLQSSALYASTTAAAAEYKQLELGYAGNQKH